MKQFLLVLLLSSPTLAENYSSFNTTTGDVIYYTEQSNGFNSFDLNTGQTVYYQKN